MKERFSLILFLLLILNSCDENKRNTSVSESLEVYREEIPLVYSDSSVLKMDSLKQLYVSTEVIKDSFPKTKFCFYAESPVFKELDSTLR